MMRSPVYILLFLSLLCCSCKKETLPSGKYAAETRDGRLLLELFDGNDCIFYFDNGEPAKGSYRISKGTLELSSVAIYPFNGNKSVWCSFGAESIRFAKIKDQSFTIGMERYFYDEYRIFDVTFRPLI